MKFVPNHIPKNYKSKAEVHIFNALHQIENYKDWICCHSLSISHHPTKRESEVDFLFIGTAGVFVLEVKGGRINRHHGRWEFIDRHNRTHRGHSPFEQAKTSLYAIKHQLAKVIQPSMKFHHLVFGYGVAFPDIEFDIKSTEWSQDIVYDARDSAQSFSDYLDRLISYWQKADNSRAQLTRQQIHQAMQYIRGDFTTQNRLIDYINESERTIVQLTHQQISILETASQNPRIFITGGAGTGKTVLATKMFEHNFNKNQRALFLCYNKLLAQALRQKLSSFLGSDFQIDTLHNFMRQYVDWTDEYIEASSDKHQLFSQQLPQTFSKKIESSADFQKFDYLIIDEGQDILFKQYLEVLDQLVKGGLAQGQWLICLDPNQNIYAGDTNQVLDDIKKRATVLELTTNCRNTDSIVRETEKITGFELNFHKITQGKSVEYLWYKDEKDQSSQVKKLIERLLKENIEPKDITILSLSKKSFIDAEDFSLPCPIHYLGTESDSQDQALQYTTIASYKGLENKIIILINIENLQSDFYKMIYYVGFTRARSMLIVSINKDQRKIYKQLGLNKS